MHAYLILTQLNYSSNSVFAYHVHTYAYVKTTAEQFGFKPKPVVSSVGLVVGYTYSMTGQSER